MNKPIGTLIRITKVLYMYALWEINDYAIVDEHGILAWTSRKGYRYIPEEQYLFEEV